MGLKEALVIVDITQKALASLALLVAGLWAYFKYFRGRTYRDRIEAEISGVTLQEGQIDYLVITVRVKNVGLSRVPIQQKGSGLRVFTGKLVFPDSKIAQELEWSSVAVISILEGHAWVEPGESVSDQRLFVLPKDSSVAVKLELQLVSETQMWSNTAVTTRIQIQK
jgi:hypothetical protein